MCERETRFCLRKSGNCRVLFFDFTVSSCWQVNQSVLCGLRLAFFTIRYPSVGKSLNSDVIIGRFINVNKPRVVCVL